MATYYGTIYSDYYNYTGLQRLTAYGYGGDDTIWGNNRNDYIDGGLGNDLLYGYSGSDTLLGKGGNDTLQGSSSTSYDSGEYDVLYSGAGYDNYIIGTQSGNSYLGAGYATIKDYNGAYDYIQVKGSRSSFYLDKTQDWSGTSSRDTLLCTNSGDVLAVIEDNTSIFLNSTYFKFV